MRIAAIANPVKRKRADLIVLPFWEGQKKPKAASALGALDSAIKVPIDQKDFLGKERESLFLYTKSETEPRICLLGLGRQEDLSVDTLRRVFSGLARSCHAKQLSDINILVPNIVELRSVTVEQCLRGVAEGLYLVNYQFDKYITKAKKSSLLEKVTLLGVLPKALKVVHEVADIAEMVYLARDLVNGNAREVDPAYLGKVAKGIAKKFPSVKAEVFDKQRIKKEKMGLLMAVGQGAACDPAFIILSYKGHPRSKDHTVLVGKGVTYDTGGLNLKPTGFMETMKEDMSGAATVLATLAAAAKLSLKVNVTAVVPTAENAIDAKSFKPGDVFTSYSGQTVEIGNTDAEGRLILADALSYVSSHLAPTRIIDLATLTGSMVIALGEEIAGFMSNNEDLTERLQEASAESGELLWQLPLPPSYKELLKSDVADLKNVGGRPAGAITAALFLQEFVGKAPWAHIDIAGTSFSKKEKHIVPKNGVGFGVRLLIDLLKNL